MKKYSVWEHLLVAAGLIVVLATFGSMFLKGERISIIIGSFVVFIAVLIFEYLHYESSNDQNTKNYIAFGIPLLIIAAIIAVVLLK